MKKFLLSIFAVMLAVFSVQAEEVSGTITFKTSGSDSSAAATNANFVSNQVTSNGGFTLSCTATNNCYTGKSGLKMSSGKANGSFTLNLGGTYNVKKVIVNAVKYSSDAANLSVNSETAQTLTTSLADYTFEINKEISTIKVDMEKRGYIASITIVYEVAGEGGGETPDVPVVQAPTAPTLTPSCNFDGSMNVEITNIAEGATAYYTTNGTTPSATDGTMYTGSFEITATTTVKAIAVNEGGASGVVSATYTKNEPVTPPAEGEVVDVLNRALTGVTSTSYSEWSGKTVTSTAVYAGQSAGGNDAIQLRSNNSNSGIVTTKSGGKAKKVVVEWQSGTSNGRTLNVYGKNSAYTAATDLYNDSKQGTLLGTIVKGTSTTLEISGDYEYIGLRSASGAMYLTSVSITWDASAGVTPVAPNAPVLTDPQSFSGSMTVTITSDATVYYTTDGTTPSKTNGTEYTVPFEITATTTVKAVAVNEVGESEVAEATYTYLEPIDLSNCTVAEAIEAYKNGQTGPATITGYIVGAVNNGLNNAQFTSETEVETNILIADNAEETDVTKCMPIKLASGTVVRNVLNLAANKNVYKKKITIECELQAYFSVAGTQTVETAGLYWNVTDAGYATLYLGYKVEIPSTVKAHIVTKVNDGFVTLTQVEGVVAANTGLILEGEGEHLFNITSSAVTADVEDNLLQGTVAATEIDVEAYVLGNVDGVGLYKAEMAGGVWLNNANKAYLPMPAGAEGIKSFSFRFDGEGTTAIENVEVENEVKAIYDLTGRKVETISAPGIYIVNGVKRVVR